MTKLRQLLGFDHAVTPATPVKQMVSFDPHDGVKRVIIEVGPDAAFRPPQWYGMTGGAGEAAIIVAHQAFICMEVLGAREIQREMGAADGN